MATLTSTSDVKTQENVLPHPARIGRSIEKTRLEVISLLLSNIKYEQGDISNLVHNAKEIISFLEEDNVQSVKII